MKKIDIEPEKLAIIKRACSLAARRVCNLFEDRGVLLSNEDMMQEGFLCYAKKRAFYDSLDADSLHRFLFVESKNRLYDKLRRKRTAVASLDETTEKAGDIKEIAERLPNAADFVWRLDPDVKFKRRCALVDYIRHYDDFHPSKNPRGAAFYKILYAFLEDKKPLDIATALGVSSPRVYSILRRFIERAKSDLCDVQFKNRTSPEFVCHCVAVSF